MRRTFAQVLKENKISIRKEYEKLYNSFYIAKYCESSLELSIQELISMHFLEPDYMNIRKTCFSLEEFNKKYNFDFTKKPEDFDEQNDMDYFISFFEYVYNLISPMTILAIITMHYKMNYMVYISDVMENIGYEIKQMDNSFIFVPKDMVAFNVSESEVLPDSLSYKVIEYNHHSLRGNIEGKKEILLKFAHTLESKKTELKSCNKNLASEIFTIFNNCNIRHNNVDENCKSSYNSYIAEISEKELEEIYDETYQMCLLAFMELEHLNRKEKISDLKNRINNKTG